MNKNIIDVTSNLPSISSSYSPLDIVGNTVGRYFDYKKETAMIKHETKKLKEQTRMLVKRIDAELEKSLDLNEKSFKQEMYRLKMIATDLKNGSKNQKEILKHISMLTKQLGDSTVPLSVKEMIPQLLEMAHQQLSVEGDRNMQKLTMMGNYDPNQKQIKG